MGRLTARNFRYCDSDFMDSGMAEAMNKLAHYEDLEEQGKLITLPCKHGDTIYKVFGNEIYERNVLKVDVYTPNNYLVWYEYGEDCMCLLASDYNKIWFSTKEEAEVKLKELKEGAK